MDDVPVSSGGRTGRKITGAESMRRRAHVRIADAENRIEGITRDPSSNAIFAAYVRGDIEVCDMVPLYKEQLARE